MTLDNTPNNSEIVAAMERFHRVWARVADTGHTPQAGGILPALLRTFAQLHRIYAVLYHRFSGEAQKKFREMSRETAQHLRQLQAEYYMQTGQIWTSKKESLPADRRELLRSAILLEQTIAELCSRPESPSHRKLGTAAANRAEAGQKILILCF